VQILTLIEKEWFNELCYFIEYIGNIDVLITKAFVAREYNYCCPTIIDIDTSATATATATSTDTTAITTKSSYFNAKNMRHCLIEQLQTNEIYIANDVYLGKNNTNGILLYGTNAIGKTSLIRSIGICVILAQSGMFVPCDSFEYYPYQSIFSRIIGNDNLFKNLSTFQVEMSELRVILNESNENSLILGDEVCSSTELESGLSIIMAALMELHERNSSFIFATHFHDIVHFEEMKELTKIAIKHLEVHYDPSTNKLIYDRKLKDGIGITSYGLTVCKSMNMPVSFIERAIEIRNRHYILNTGILSQQSSKYNSKKIKGICEKCNLEFSTEVHHKIPQKKANKKGFIQTENKVFHKNHPANLMNLCESCHKEMHKEMHKLETIN
jgi:DNA mismatch repair protein MutS